MRRCRTSSFFYSSCLFGGALYISYYTTFQLFCK
nr:MAG TPA: hypothetical protein [Caudoviricetes sp.]